MGRGGSLTQLGAVAIERFKEASAAGSSGDVEASHLSDAEGYYLQAMDSFPASALREREVAHNQLGMTYSAAGQVEMALSYYSKSVRYCEAMQDPFAAGQTRMNAAILLANSDRLGDAREWARAALRDFQASPNADQDVVKTLRLLEQIESYLQANSPQS